MNTLVRVTVPDPLPSPWHWKLWRGPAVPPGESIGYEPKAARLCGLDPHPEGVRESARDMLVGRYRAGNLSAPLFAEFAGATHYSPSVAAMRNVLSVLIPVRGAHACLELALRCLVANTDARALQVVLACCEEEADAVSAVWDHVLACTGRWRGTLCGVLVTTPHAQGYPANVNCARLYADGDLLVLLNSDTYVPPAWDVLMAAQLRHYGDVVAVGPCGQVRDAGLDVRAEAAPERVAAVADNLARGELKDKPSADTGRLVGFCLMVRASAFDRVGGLWEGYGLGNFDDDDLSLKLRFVGRLRTVPMVVGHGVSRSFAELPNASRTYEKLLEENGAKFHARWDWAADLLPEVPMGTTLYEVTR